MTDLIFDPDEVDEHLIVRCRISTGPRRGDPGFDPCAGDTVRIDDGAGMPLRARVVCRAGDVLIVRIIEPHPQLIDAVRLALRG